MGQLGAPCEVGSQSHFIPVVVCLIDGNRISVRAVETQQCAGMHYQPAESLTERDNTFAHYFCTVCGFGIRLGYSSSAKSDVGKMLDFQNVPRHLNGTVNLHCCCELVVQAQDDSKTEILLHRSSDIVL